MGDFKGNIKSGNRLDFGFTTVDSTGLPTAITSGSVCVRKSGLSSLAPAGAVLSSSGGMHHVIIFTASASTFYTAANDYEVFLGNGFVGTTTVTGYQVGEFAIENRLGMDWASTTGTATLNSNLQNIKGVGAVGTAGYTSADWATSTGTATLNSNVQNIKGAGSVGAAGYVGIGWATSTGTATVQAGQISYGSFTGTATINANVQYVATPAGQTIADRVLLRNIASGSDGTRTVQDSFRAIRNRTVLTSTGQYSVYQEDDATTAWTAVTTTVSAVSINSVDPA